MNSESRHDHQISRITTPNPFHLHTEVNILWSNKNSFYILLDQFCLPRISCVVVSTNQERGAEKERKFVMEVTQKQLEEERARFRKANPYPYTTDYPVVCKYEFIFFLPYIVGSFYNKGMTWIITFADSTKARAKAMDQTRTFPIGESGQA